MIGIYNIGTGTLVQVVPMLQQGFLLVQEVTLDMRHQPVMSCVYSSVQLL